MDTEPNETAPPQEQLRAWRDAHGLSQKDAAVKVGATGPAWHEWETGGRTPRGHRAALEILTGIPATAWADDGERDAIATATRSRADLDALDIAPATTSDAARAA